VIDAWVVEERLAVEQPWVGLAHRSTEKMS